MKYIIWGWNADARIIFDCINRNISYFVDDIGKDEETVHVYKGCPVYSVSFFCEDTTAKYIYISQVYEYSRVRKILNNLSYKEGIDFSGAFEYLPLEARFQKGQYKKGSWVPGRELLSIWKHRVCQMAQYIDEKDKSVLDAGCGTCYLKELLADKDIQYIGCDCVILSEGVWQCDFNCYEFTDIKVDVMFVSGSLEYIEPADWFLHKLCEFSNKIILSYTPLEYMPNSERRKSFGYCNSYSIQQIKDIMFWEGFRLKDSSHSVTRDLIMIFIKIKEEKNVKSRRVDKKQEAYERDYADRKSPTGI